MYREKTTYTSYIYIYVHVRIYASSQVLKEVGTVPLPPYMEYLQSYRYHINNMDVYEYIHNLQVLKEVGKVPLPPYMKTT